MSKSLPLSKSNNQRDVRYEVTELSGLGGGGVYARKFPFHEVFALTGLKPWPYI